MAHAQSAYCFNQRTMKDKMPIQSPSLMQGLDQERLLIFAWNAGISAYSCVGPIARKWQMLNP
jgi:hypothetical protein